MIYGIKSNKIKTCHPLTILLTFKKKKRSNNKLYLSKIWEKNKKEEAIPTTKIYSMLMLNLKEKKLIVLNDKVNMAGTLNILASW